MSCHLKNIICIEINEFKFMIEYLKILNLGMNDIFQVMNWKKVTLRNLQN